MATIPLRLDPAEEKALVRSAEILRSAVDSLKTHSK